MKYNCPLCKTELTEALGNSIHPGDPKYGSILFCPVAGLETICPAQQVMGHGDTFKDAYGVIQAKFMAREERVA